METLASPRSVEIVLRETNDAMPQMVSSLRPSNGEEQKQSFLNGAVRNPSLRYDALQKLDIGTADATLAALDEELQSHPDIDPKFKPQYSAFIDYRRKQTNLLGSLQALHGDDEAVKPAARQQFSELSESLFGTADIPTYHALLSNRLKNIGVPLDDPLAVQVYQELLDSVPVEALQDLPKPYEVSEKTFNTVRTVALALYEKLLEHIPDRDEDYNAEEILAILTKIVRTEFGESADDWEVKQVKQKGLSVNASKRRVQVSPTITADGPKLRGLAVHEIGVHMLRALRGRESDFLPMALGLAGHGEAEEGLGTIMQQAVNGEFEIAGAGHYITAGHLATGHDFRETFEMNWRLIALEDLKPGEALTTEAIEKARDTA